MEIDLNCDLGEGCDLDKELIPLITSANIACGFHAGNPATAFHTLQLAARHGVRAGAHPGFLDRENFGRRELIQSEQQLLEETVYQVGALGGLAKVVGISLQHLKPHGALYNLACRDDHYARPIVEAAALFQLPLVALPGSRLQTLSAGRCRFVAEGFADRRYQVDGSLVPRSDPGAFVESTEESVQQVEGLIRERGVQTVCVHGDNPRALEFVRELRKALTNKGIAIRPF
jgi:5-oxoprolinase (ATP-hydrolysing) subunit A